MNAETQAGPVLITGGSGYLAGWIIKKFLDQGATVHATVRNPSNQASIAHLESMALSSPGTLKLFEADLLDPGSFDKAMDGCETVLHTASPFVMSGFKDAEDALIRPAREGTGNVLASVNRTDSVRRVVLTSSIAAIFGDSADIREIPGGVFTEEHWNKSSSVHHQPYSYSKTVAEQHAWELSEQQNRWDLVSINPGFVLGPSFNNNSHSESLRIIKRLCDGTFKLGVPRLWLPVVDVRDVAEAHFNAATISGASGRNIVVAGEVSLMDIVRCLQDHFGTAYPFPRRLVPKLLIWLVAPMYDLRRDYVSKNVGYPVTMSNRRSREVLEMNYRCLDQTIIDHFEQMLEDGVLDRAA